MPPDEATPELASVVDRAAHTLLHAAVDGVVTIDESGTILTVNPAAEGMFGYAAEEIVGKNVRILMPSPYRDEHDDYLGNYLRTGRRKIIGIGREVHGARKGGEIFPLDLAVSEVFIGTQRIFLGILRDATERAQAEKALRVSQEALRRQRDFAESLVETAQAIVLVLDNDANIVRYNRYMEEISGFPLAEVQGRNWFECFVPEPERPRIHRLFRRAIRGIPTRGNVNGMLTRSGRTRQVEWHDRVLLDREGHIVGLLATGQDVTERLALEEQFRHAQKMEAVGRLAGGVAHDFNTLLGTIRGYSEMILSALEHEHPASRHAEQIRRTAERGASLTRQLLTFSRHRPPQFAVVSVNETIRELEELLRRLIGEGVNLELELDPGAGCTRIDAAQLGQILMNLVVNAVQAMHNRGTLTIETHPERRAKGTRKLEDEPRARNLIRLVVADDGCGMDAETRLRAFEPFFTTKEVGKGTGLGLSTVYGIVQQVGGTIEIHSEPGRGTRIEILFAQVDAEPTPRPEEPQQPKRDLSQGRTMLLVEDDAAFLGMLRELLESRGYDVLATASPDEASRLAANRQAPIDVVLSDMVMPGMSVGAFLAEIRASHPEARIVLMSGYTEDALEERGLSHADLAYLQKPFSMAQLLAVLEQCLAAD